MAQKCFILDVGNMQGLKGSKSWLDPINGKRLRFGYTTKILFAIPHTYLRL